MESQLIIVLVVLLLLYLLITSNEHLELKHKHFPHVYYRAYVNDLEVTGPRLLNNNDIQLRHPPHPIDMQNQFLVRDNTNIIFDMTQ